MKRQKGFVPSEKNRPATIAGGALLNFIILTRIIANASYLFFLRFFIAVDAARFLAWK